MLITYVTGNKVIFKTPPALSRTEFSMKCMLWDLSLDLVLMILGENHLFTTHLFTTHVQVEGLFQKQLSCSPDKSWNVTLEALAHNTDLWSRNCALHVWWVADYTAHFNQQKPIHPTFLSHTPLWYILPRIKWCAERQLLAGHSRNRLAAYPPGCKQPQIQL